MSLKKIISNKKIQDNLDNEIKDDLDNEIKDDIDNEIQDDLDNEIQDESENEIEYESENEIQDDLPGENQINEKKEKPKKLTHEEIILEITKIIEAENILETEISELEKTLIAKIKLRTTYRKNKNKYIGLLPKSFQDSISKIRKEKKKRNNNNKSGILAEHPVPLILQKFLDLSESTLLMRPKVFSLLNNKFKELGLKKGQETILDKKTAKLFGFEEGHIIKFQECQKFLADIYEKANTKVTL